MKSISIIVPVFNTEKYLQKCIDSIVNQTIENFELIIINDGSSDNSLNIIKKFENKFPKLITVIDQKNQGQSVARNMGLRIAKGEYIGFVDSDDWIDPEMYEEMVSTAKINGSDIVICDMVDHFANYEVYHNSSNFVDRFTVTPSACNKIFKREFIDDIDFPVGLWYEDFCFTTKLLFKTDNIGVVHKGYYHCHNREVSTMYNNNALKNLDMITVLDEIKDYLKKNKLWNQYQYVHNYFIVDHVLITTINRLTLQNNDDKQRVINTFREYARDNSVDINQAKHKFKIATKRIVIAKLNYYGFNRISNIILKITALIKSENKEKL